MFLCIIFIWPRDLDLRTFDLGGVGRIKLNTCNARTNFSFLRLTVPELWTTQSDHITITRNGHCACAESRDLSPGRGRKHYPYFEILDPNLSIHFVSFRALRRRLSHVIGQKLRFPIVKSTKFTAHVQYHVTCAQASPKPHETIFDPEFTIQLLWGYDDD